MTDYNLPSLVGDVLRPYCCIIHITTASSGNWRGGKNGVRYDASLPLSHFPNKTRMQRLPSLAYPPTPSAHGDSWFRGCVACASEWDNPRARGAVSCKIMWLNYLLSVPVWCQRRICICAWRRNRGGVLACHSSLGRDHTHASGGRLLVDEKLARWTH